MQLHMMMMMIYAQHAGCLGLVVDHIYVYILRVVTHIEMHTHTHIHKHKK